MKKDLNETEEIFRLMREMLAEVEGLKHIMTGGTTTTSEKAHKKVQDMVEEAFNPLKPIKLSKEVYKKIEEADNEPISEEAIRAVNKFISDTNKFYGTVEDKDWIQEKCNTNTPPTSVPEHPSKGNIKSKTTDNFMKTREEIEGKLSELEIVVRYMKPNEKERILGWIDALRWVLNRTYITSIMDNR